MIFFLTTIIPPSNCEVEFRKFKSYLFNLKKIIPLPWTLIPISCSSEEPPRPTRQNIASQYPEILTPGSLEVEEGYLTLDFQEGLPFFSDPGQYPGLVLFPGKMVFGEIISEPTDSMDMVFRSFSKYSLATYKIETPSPDNWWKHMSWSKLWEVKKSTVKPK